MKRQKTSSFWLIIVFVITAGIIFLCDFPDREGQEETRNGLIILDETEVPEETAGESQEIADDEVEFDDIEGRMDRL